MLHVLITTLFCFFIRYFENNLAIKSWTYFKKLKNIERGRKNEFLNVIFSNYLHDKSYIDIPIKKLLVIFCRVSRIRMYSVAFDFMEFKQRVATGVIKSNRHNNAKTVNHHPNINIPTTVIMPPSIIIDLCIWIHLFLWISFLHLVSFYEREIYKNK